MASKIGHKEARRSRRDWGLTEWNYENPNNNRLAHFCAFRGVNLAELDAFIERLEAEGVGAGDELRERRRKASQAMSRQANDIVLRHMEWIVQRKEAIEREEQLLPLALKGQGRGDTDRENLRKANDARSEEQKQVKKKHAGWRALANEIRQQSPGLTKAEIARRVKRRTGSQEDADYIARKI